MASGGVRDPCRADDFHHVIELWNLLKESRGLMTGDEAEAEVCPRPAGFEFVVMDWNHA